MPGTRAPKPGRQVHIISALSVPRHGGNFYVPMQQHVCGTQCWRTNYARVVLHRRDPQAAVISRQHVATGPML